MNRFRKYFYTFLTIPVFGVLYIVTFLTVIITLLFAYLNLKSSVHNIIRFWAKSTFWIAGKKLHITGKQFVKSNEKYILVVNHSSLFDIMAVMSLFPGISWFGRERLLKIPLFGHVLKMIDYVPMRTTNIRNTKEMISQLVGKSDGLTVAIFPEGTRTTDGELGRFRKGFIHLLRASSKDVLPVTLNGFFDFKPKNRLRINFNTKLEVIVHKPIRNQELVKSSDNEILLSVKDAITSSYLYETNPNQLNEQ